MRRTPLRPRAFRNVAGSDPVSTRSVLQPLCTMMPSPWPTSSTTMRTSAVGNCANVTAIVNATAATSVRRARFWVGCGQSAHTLSMETLAAMHPPLAGTAMHAPGIRARCRASVVAPRASTPAASTHARPRNEDHPPRHAPPRTSPRAGSMSGSTSAFAIGATTETAPKAAADTGVVATCAVIAAARISPAARGSPGTAAPSHAATIGPNTSSPPTALTESAKPTSNAARGWTISTAAPPQESDARASLRTAAIWLTASALSMAHARTAEIGKPVIAAKTHAVSTTIPWRIRRLRTTLRAAVSISPQTIPRCVPETASACESPSVRKSASTSEPRTLRRSPSPMPASSAPGSPSMRARSRAHRARHR